MTLIKALTPKPNKNRVLERTPVIQPTVTKPVIAIQTQSTNPNFALNRTPTLPNYWRNHLTNSTNQLCANRNSYTTGPLIGLAEVTTLVEDFLVKSKSRELFPGGASPNKSRTVGGKVA